jgi:hypothetical protein
MVANDQAGRDANLWLTPHELEQEFNAFDTPAETAMITLQKFR